MPRLLLPEGIPIDHMLRAALGSDSPYAHLLRNRDINPSNPSSNPISRSGDEAVNMTSLVNNLRDLLVAKGPMLEEYFRIGISASGDLLSMPELLSGHTPLEEALPVFLLQLAVECEWEDELECFRTVARTIATFYSYLPSEVDQGNDKASSSEHASSADTRVGTGAGTEAGTGTGAVVLTRVGAQLFNMTIYPALHSLLIPPDRFGSNGTVVQVAALEQLYKVFERC